MRTLALIAAVVAAIATAHAASWQTHNYETDGFTVDFSGTVSVKPIELDADTMSSLTRSTSYMQESGNTYAYVVGASLMKDASVFNFDAAVNGTIKSYKCAKIESDTSAKQTAGQSREIHGAECSNNFRVGARFVQRDRWFYQVVYMIAPAANAADAAHFLASFKLVPVK